MSLLSAVIKYGKDILLLGERVDVLVAERKEMSNRLEDHERRLIRIETLINSARHGVESCRRRSESDMANGCATDDADCLSKAAESGRKLL